jgi:hypothetical protein
MTSALVRVPGVSETHLPAQVLAALPPSVPAAPWRARATGVFWWRRLDHAGRDAARAALPDRLAGALQVTAAAGAVISYTETPVGPYHEVIGLITGRHGLRTIVHVPFIAVDSLASVVGGRANWALPKTLATFTGEPSDGGTISVRADPSDSGPWSISATPRRFGPSIPFAAPALATVLQVGPDGDLWRSFSTAHGRVRPTRVDVELDAASFAPWFPTGRCWGATATFTGNFRAARRG